MEELLQEAKEELKRVDHLVFVSLKYTRTVDVIKSVINRLIESQDRMVASLLEYEKQKKKIESYPISPGQRLEFLKSLYHDKTEIAEYLQFHSLLRKIMRMPYTKREEYRRNVTMTVSVDNETIDINIDQLRVYYDKAKEFLQLTQKIIKGEND